jgi:hypothetical protein
VVKWSWPGEHDLPDARAMTIEQLRNLYNAQPFRAFVIHLADGRAIPVHHREFMMTVPSGRTIFVAQPDDTVNIIDLLLVTDIELKPAPNGPGRRRKA